jgi:DNA-directed RNA polymerase subunit RPC12/RpoP
MHTISFFCVICGCALQASSDSQHDLVECHSCFRFVPVPRPVSLRGKFARCQSVLPPEVLELSVTFECTACSSRLCTDARWEGRKIGCPDCGETTRIPRWSTLPSWPQESGNEERPRVPVPQPSIDTNAAVLSSEEIEFLRGAASMNPGAAA